MKVWCVIVHGLHNSCYECNGGGDADVYFVAAERASQARRLVLDHRTDGNWRHQFEIDDENRHAEIYPYKVVSVRDWRGKRARILKDREVERA